MADGHDARDRRVTRLGPLGLVVIADGAWIWALASLLQEYTLRDPILSIAAFVLFVALGVTSGRLLAPRLGRAWPFVGVGIALVAAVVGLLASPDARHALAGAPPRSLIAALARHPAGPFAGLAVLRGFAHLRLPLAEDALGRLLGAGVGLLCLVTLFGGLVADPWRAHFEQDATVASLAFVGSALLALALTRQTVAGAPSGADWRRNPAWLAILVGLVGLLILLAVPAAGALAPVVELAVGILVAPILLAGLIFGWTRSSARVVLIILVLSAVAVTILPAIGANTSTTTTGGGGAGGPSVSPPIEDQRVLYVSGGLLLLVGLVVALILVRIWMRRLAVNPDGVPELRFIDRSAGPPRRRSRRRLPFGPAPADAVQAYRRLVSEIEPRRGVRRGISETPAEHARRLRQSGRGALSLELLAADYGLAQFGDVPLTDAEHRRAIGRWRGLRRRLQAVRPPPQTRRAPGGEEHAIALDGSEEPQYPSELRARRFPER